MNKTTGNPPQKRKARADRKASEPIVVGETVVQKRKALARDRRQTWFGMHSDEMKFLSIKQRGFLKAYTEELTIAGAIRVTGVDHTAHHYWMRSHGVYKRLFEDLREFVVEALEGEAFRRSYHGVTEAVFYQGEVCGSKTNYSDTLLMFLLRAANPDKYRERSTMDLNVKPIDADIAPALKQMSRETLRKIRELVEQDQLQNKLIESGQEQSA